MSARITPTADALDLTRFEDLFGDLTIRSGALSELRRQRESLDPTDASLGSDAAVYNLDLIHQAAQDDPTTPDCLSRRELTPMRFTDEYAAQITNTVYSMADGVLVDLRGALYFAWLLDVRLHSVLTWERPQPGGLPASGNRA